MTRNTKTFVLAIAVLAAIAGIGGGLLQSRLDTSLSSLVPTGSDAFAAMQARNKVFGGDPIVISLHSDAEKGLLLDPDQLPKVLALEGKLSRLDGVAVVYGPATVLNQTAKAIRQLLARISGTRDGIEEEVQRLARNKGASAAKARRAAQLAVGQFDRRYGALVMKALPVGLPELSNQTFVGNVLFNSDGDPRSQWKYLVPGVRDATILVRAREGLDESATANLVSQVRSAIAGAGLDIDPALVTGVPVLTSAVTSQARHELPVLGAVALAGVGAVLLLVPWSRRRATRLRPLLCALAGSAITLSLFGWFGMSLSLGVVAFLPILLGVGSDFPMYLSHRVPLRTVLVAVAAAVAGFGSLAISPLPFVRELGIALALGLSLTVLTALVTGGFVRHPDRIDSEARASRQQGSRRRPRWVAVLATAGAGAAAFGWIFLPSLQVEASPEKLAAGIHEIDVANTVSKKLGFSGQVDVLLHGRSVLSPDALSWFQAAEDRVVSGHGDKLQPILTVHRLLGFVGTDATTEQVESAAGIIPSYLLNAVVAPDHETGSMSLGVGLEDVNDQKHLLAEVRSELPPPPQGYTSQVVGLPVVAVASLNAVAQDRYRLTLVGLAATLLVLMIGLPERKDAYRAGMTMALAGGWAFAAVWAIQGSLNPLNVAVGALLTVTACEFSVMLSHAARYRSSGVARSVVTAAAAGVTGYLVLTLSGLSIIGQFGALLAGAVALSLLSALLVVLVFPPSLVVADSLATECEPQEQTGRLR